MQGVEADASLCDALKILYGDASTLPAEEESVDGILMECSFSRMEQPEQVLKECIRVLKPGGCLAVSDMIACGEEIIPEDFPHDAGTRAFLGRLEYAETVAARITRAGFRITGRGKSHERTAGNVGAGDPGRRKRGCLRGAGLLLGDHSSREMWLLSVGM